MPLLKKGEYMRQYDVQKKRVYKIWDFIGWNQLTMREKYILSYFLVVFTFYFVLGISFICAFMLWDWTRS